MSCLQSLDRNALVALAEQKLAEIEDFEQAKEDLVDLTKEVNRLHVYCEAQKKVMTQCREHAED